MNKCVHTIIFPSTKLTKPTYGLFQKFIGVVLLVEKVTAVS